MGSNQRGLTEESEILEGYAVGDERGSVRRDAAGAYTPRQRSTRQKRAAAGGAGDGEA